MLKKPTAPILDEHPNSIDDDTFAEMAVDEERLNAALVNPQAIRTGEANQHR